MDNLYLKLSRRKVQPGFTFITAGALNGELHWPGIGQSYVYVTVTTFHGEHRGNARCIVADLLGIAIYADGALPCALLGVYDRIIACAM